MFSDIGTVQDSYDGVIVTIVTPVMRVWNPDLYLQLLKVGGAMAVAIPCPGNAPGVVGYDSVFKIFLLEEITKGMTPEEREVLLLQQLTHIRKGHLLSIVGGRMSREDKRRYMFVADYESSKALGAAVVRSSLLKILDRRFEILFRNHKKIAKFFTFLSRLGLMNERLKWLQVMIDRGM